MLVLVIGADTKNIDAYLSFLKGLEQTWRFNKEAIALARKAAQAAIEIDPMYPSGYRLLAWTHMMDIWLGASKDPKMSVKKAFKLLEKVRSLDENSPGYYFLMGQLLLLTRQHDKAIKSGERAVSLSPNNSTFLNGLAMIHRYNGEPEKALSLQKKAMRLNPYPESLYYTNLGHAYLDNEKYEESIQAYSKAAQISPNQFLNHLGLASAYSQLGHNEKAIAAMSETLALRPQLSIEWAKTLPYRHKTDLDRAVARMEKAGLPKHPPLPLPDKPSIAVLAFDNLSGDPEQEYFSDGIAENIITALSKVGALFVIARNSSFTYKGKPVKVQQVGRELGVRYVLEGSVQKAGDRVRITAQLVDAKNGQHLWAERYDRELKDLFALQDQITMKVVTALRVVLTEGERALLKQKEPISLEAYLKVLEGNEAWLCQCKGGNDRARNLAAEAISFDPEYAAAHVLESKVYFMDQWLSPDKRPITESIKLSMESALKAIELDASDPAVHGLLSYLYLYPNYKLYEKAIALGQKAVELAPNSAAAHFYLGTALAYDGRYEEAIKIYKEMFRLNPRHQNSAYHIHIGLAYICSEQYDLAISEYNTATQIAPKSYFPYMMLAPAYVLYGQEKKAQAAADKLSELNPKFSIVTYEKGSPLRKKEDLDRIVAAMRKAGLPE